MQIHSATGSIEGTHSVECIREAYAANRSEAHHRVNYVTGYIRSLWFKHLKAFQIELECVWWALLNKHCSSNSMEFNEFHMESNWNPFQASDKVKIQNAKNWIKEKETELMPGGLPEPPQLLHHQQTGWRTVGWFAGLRSSLGYCCCSGWTMRIVRLVCSSHRTGSGPVTRKWRFGVEKQDDRISFIFESAVKELR